MSRLKKRRNNVSTKQNRAIAVNSDPAHENFIEEYKLQQADAIVNYQSQFKSADESLFQTARLQWRLGDWKSLAQLQIEMIENNPQRAKLSLLAAAGRFQLGDSAGANQFVKLAKDWGGDERLIRRTLIACVYSTLGKAAALAQNEYKAQKYDGLFSQMSGVKGQLELNKKEQYSDTLINSIVEECLKCNDLFEKIDSFLLGSELTNPEKFRLCITLSEKFYRDNENLLAQHYINQSQNYLSNDTVQSREQALLIAKKLIQYGRDIEALDVLIEKLIGENDLSEAERKALFGSYDSFRLYQKAKSEHGHELLLNYLKSDKVICDIGFKPKVMVEIGTTRENVYGQSSTKKLAEYCKASNMKFITVDMDPHNTNNARDMLSKVSPSFDAVNMKGEDYLKNYKGIIDFVFLDAYDFDHGKHSELRQSRYEKFLGGRINEELCHKMHLECAEALVEKLSANGVICIDDTWIDNQGSWTAKGTLAVPFLLNNGFEIVDARNRAALLKRKQE